MEDLEKAAQTIARKAIELAFDPDYMSPFALSARQNGINVNGNFNLRVHFFFFFFVILILIGGKPDDVTVLLARVSR